MRIIKVIDNEPLNSIKKIMVGTSSLIISMFSRYDLNKYISTPLANQQAVYLLYNETTTGSYCIYVGETEEICKRLQQHDKSFTKSFWTKTIVIQDSCLYLNKAHFKYLEYMLYTYLKTANRGTVTNSTIPTKPRLSEDDEILATEFLSSIQDVLKNFNIKFLEPPIIGNFEEETSKYSFILDGCEATIRVNGKSDFILEKGAICTTLFSPEDKDSFKDIFKLRKSLKFNQIEETNFIELQEDVSFDSEHEAFTFVTLKCLNSSLYWKNNRGEPLIFR